MGSTVNTATEGGDQDIHYIQHIMRTLSTLLSGCLLLHVHARPQIAQMEGFNPGQNSGQSGSGSGYNAGSQDSVNFPEHIEGDSGYNGGSDSQQDGNSGFNPGRNGDSGFNPGSDSDGQNGNSGFNPGRNGDSDSILDQAVMAKMETLDLILEEMENQGSTVGGIVTQGSMLASLGVWLLVLQVSEPPSSL